MKSHEDELLGPVRHPLLGRQVRHGAPFASAKDLAHAPSGDHQAFGGGDGGAQWLLSHLGALCGDARGANGHLNAWEEAL